MVHQAGEKKKYFTHYVNNIAYKSFTTDRRPEQKQWRKFFVNLDILLVNGNH